MNRFQALYVSVSIPATNSSSRTAALQYGYDIYFEGVGEPQQQDGPDLDVVTTRGFTTHFAVFTRRPPAVARFQPTIDPFDGQEDYYPFLKTQYSKYIP
jgi:hypothetical protein